MRLYCRERKESIKVMFENWDETMIWSCLQGVMGEIYANAAEHAAVAVLGDFAFCAGKPDEALLQRVHESCERQFMIVVPQNEAWDTCMQKYYGAHAKRVLRYACGAKLILNCLERGLYPSWDAQNKWSLALAEKLGYHFSHTYTAYEIGF